MLASFFQRPLPGTADRHDERKGIEAVKRLAADAVVGEETRSAKSPTTNDRIKAATS
jgi:hypothetical protein